MEDMERNMLSCTLLFDVYGDLLTEKQRICCDLRYNQDLSLGEIAELEGISRQAVRDLLLRAESQMQELEDNLGSFRWSVRQAETLEYLRQAADLAQSQGNQDILQLINCAMAHLKE